MEATALSERRRFTVRELYCMGEAGVFDEDERVELIDGEVIVVPPPGRRHAYSVNRLNNVLSRLLDAKAIISVQNPIILSDYGLPLPDVVVLKWRDDFYLDGPPKPDDVLLVIEVADSSLRADRGRKLAAYAQAGIREYWIVNLNAGRIEVYRQPSGDEYLQRIVHQRGATLTIEALPDVSIRVDDVLPPS